MKLLNQCFQLFFSLPISPKINLPVRKLFCHRSKRTNQQILSFVSQIKSPYMNNPIFLFFSFQVRNLILLRNNIRYTNHFPVREPFFL